MRCYNQYMVGFQPKTSFDKVFEISILLKAIDGLLELIGGLLLLFISPAGIMHLVNELTQHELSVDPHDFIANHLLHTAQSLTGGTLIYGSIYLIAHGLAK